MVVGYIDHQIKNNFSRSLSHLYAKHKTYQPKSFSVPQGMDNSRHQSQTYLKGILKKPSNGCSKGIKKHNKRVKFKPEPYLAVPVGSSSEEHYFSIDTEPKHYISESSWVKKKNHGEKTQNTMSWMLIFIVIVFMILFILTIYYLCCSVATKSFHDSYIHQRVLDD